MDGIITIGSIVELDNNERYMVIGYYAKDKKDNNKIHDFIGCKYPKVSLEGIKLFDFKNVKKTIFNGYSNPIIFKALEMAREEVKNEQ